MRRTLLLTALGFVTMPLFACAPKQAPVSPPVMETEPDLTTAPLPPEVEDEAAPPDDPEEVDLAAPEEAPLDDAPTVPDPEKPSPGPHVP